MRDLKSFLEQFSAAALSVMCTGTGAQRRSMRKDDLVGALMPRLFLPERIKREIASLSESQLLILQQLKRHPEVSSAALEDILSAHGKQAHFHKALRDLMRMGLCFPRHEGRGMTELWRDVSYAQFMRVWAPPEVLLFVPDPPPPGTLAPVEPEPEGGAVRPFDEVMQDVFVFLRFVENNRLPLLQSGDLNKKDYVRLNRDLTLRENLSDVRRMDEAGWLYLLKKLLDQLGLLREDRGELKVAPNAAEFLSRPPAEQAKRLLEAWRKQTAFNEFQRIPGLRFESTKSSSRQGDFPASDRVAAARRIVLDLLAQGAEPGAWHALADLVSRVKQHDVELLIPRRGASSWSYRSEPRYEGIYDARQTGYFEREISMRTGWEKVEGGFVWQMVQGPLFWLGLVELSREQPEPLHFRLTPLGTHALGIEGALPETAAAPDARPLTVQPNLEILVPAEPEVMGLLFQLERFADRVSADRVLVYRLTRESVYRGLQSGLSAEDLLDFLAQRSRTELAQNVVYSIRDWAALRERIHVRRDALVIEADSAGELEAVLDTLPANAARRLTDTLAVVGAEQRAAVLRRLQQAEGQPACFDYHLAPGQVWTVNERREVRVPRAGLDWFLEQELREVAEEVQRTEDEIFFQVTKQSLERARANGWTVERLLDFLTQHATSPLHPDATLTLRGWAGTVRPLALDEVMALAAPDEATMDTLLAVDELREFILQRVSPTVALLKDGVRRTLSKALRDRGLRYDAALLTTARPVEAPASPTHPPPPSPARAEGRLSPTAAQLPKPPIPPKRGRARETEDFLYLSTRDTRELLEQAIEQKKQVRIEYYDASNRRTVRTVDPQQVYRSGSTAYLEAYCHLRQDDRVFRVNQIRGIRVLEETTE